jgi:RNA polymerase subunit RPABC4/transcription elongation factor Spt4
VVTYNKVLCYTKTRTSCVVCDVASFVNEWKKILIVFTGNLSLLVSIKASAAISLISDNNWSITNHVANYDYPLRP